jgi:tRNA pseudouridine55 synthase
VNGILIIDKPEGFTSHDVVAKLRGILRTKAIGHTGTLDPFATGVLVALIGRATRLAQFLDKAEKEYLATIQFGFETDTGDRTGTRNTECGMRNEDVAALLTADNLEKVLAKFRGEIEQTPPMYSAKKIAGKKLYELARKGIQVERQPVKIKISELEIAGDSENESAIRNPQSAIVRVVCTAGTYVRVLAEDIGKELGTGAHLAELRRTRAGAFALRQAITLEDLEKLAAENRVAEILISPNQALAHLPQIILNEVAARKTLNGMKFFADSRFADEQLVRMCDERANLLAVGIFSESENAVQPHVVFPIEN